MATSGTRVLTRTRNDIITAAFRLLGLIKPGGTVPHPEMMDHAQDSLNDMITSWQADGVGLWLKADATLYMQYGQASYDIGPSGDHCTLSAAETTTSAAASSGASSITATSITDMADGDYIGVELDTGYFQFTTINGTPAGSTVTLTDVLTGDVDSGAFVFAYTTKVSRPLSIEDARWVQDDDTELIFSLRSRNEYMGLNDKTTAGSPNFGYYDPQLTNGKMYVWQPPSDVEYRLRFTVMQPIEVFTASTDSPDFPQEWFNALRYGLADYMGPEYWEYLDPRQYLVVQEKAREYTDKMFGNDTEAAPIQFVSVFGFEGLR